jgi:hypothetical protein
MSRSKKKTPILGITTCGSEKADKRDANRKYRRIVKQKVKGSSEELPEVKEVSDVWSFGKDGKKYAKRISKKDLRK